MSRSPLPLIALAAALVALAGCGGQMSDTATTTPPSTAAAAPGSTEAGSTTTPAAATAVDIELRDTGADGPVTVAYRLTCDGAAGQVTATVGTPAVTDPDAACALLVAERASLEPVPTGIACTEIYGGPEVATIVGTIEGEAVNATLTRADGCQIARWDKLAPLLGATSAPPGSSDAAAVPTYPDADVTVVLRRDGASGAAVTYRVTCVAAGPSATVDPADATTAAIDPGVACAALGSGASALVQPPATQACTQIYGGPATATVKGELDGKPVDVALDRTDGCQIARWDALAGLFGDAAPVPPDTPTSSDPGLAAS